MSVFFNTVSEKYDKINLSKPIIDRLRERYSSERGEKTMKKRALCLFRNNKKERTYGSSLIKNAFSSASPLVRLTRYKDNNVSEEIQSKKTDENDEFHVLYAVMKLLH